MQLTRTRIAVFAVSLLAVAAVWLMPWLSVARWWWSAGHPVMTTVEVQLTGNLHWVDDYYAVEDLGHGAYAIGEPRYGQCNFSYLITGTHDAVLFDTGPGVRDIRPVVNSLTRLPVLAIPSHLHFDHVGNLNRFEHVALPDLPALRRQSRQGSITLDPLQFLGAVEGFERPTVAVQRWLHRGESLDLGGRTLTLWFAPGHTPDSVALFDAESNRLFAGDFIYPSDVYAQLPGANLGVYARTAREMSQRTNQSIEVLGAHGCDQLPGVAVPRLGHRDLVDLSRALDEAADLSIPKDGYPRHIFVNSRMVLLAKYPWMMN